MRRIAARDVDLKLGVSVVLSEEAAHYARDVLRLTPGTVVEVFGTDGTAFTGPIESLEPLVVRLDAELDGLANEAPCHLTLYQAVVKKDRFEWVLEKATELGVRYIVPLHTARTVVVVPPNRRDARVERWQRICDAAARQSGRALAPTVHPPQTVREVCAGNTNADVEVVFSPHAERSLSDEAQHHDWSTLGHAAIWIGPEGGFDDDELGWIGDRAVACRFGPRVLRSETAGIAAVAVLQWLTGGLA